MKNFLVKEKMMKSQRLLKTFFFARFKKGFLCFTRKIIKAQETWHITYIYKTKLKTFDLHTYSFFLILNEKSFFFSKWNIHYAYFLYTTR